MKRTIHKYGWVEIYPLFKTAYVRCDAIGYIKSGGARASYYWKDVTCKNCLKKRK